MRWQVKEPVVFGKDRRAKLRYRNIREQSVQLMLPEGTEPLTNGVDFHVDAEEGRVLAISSKIPDYSNSPFSKCTPFDHTLYPIYGNGEITCYATYLFDETTQLTDLRFSEQIEQDGIFFSPNPSMKKIIVFGDSISTGCEASSDDTTYFALFQKYLEKNLNHSITMKNAAVGGESTRQGRSRFQKDVVEEQPDLVLVAFGMNDQCRAKEDVQNSVPLQEFEENIDFFVSSLLKENCQVILLNPCLPNPRWKWSAENFLEYAEVVRAMAKNYHVPFADVTKLFQMVLQEGMSYQALLKNDINHPGDYGHMLYFLALQSLMEGKKTEKDLLNTEWQRT